MKQLVRRTLAAALALTVLGTTAACAQTGGPRKVVHNQGVTEVRGTPKKVAVMSVGTLELLEALDIDAAIVPAPPAGDASTRWPEALVKKYSQDRYVKLAGGGGRSAQPGPNPQIDQLRMLKPDLIILDGRSRNLYKDLESIAPTIDLSSSNVSLVDSVVQNILAVGTAFGKERQASEKAQALLRDVRAVRESAARQGTALVLFGVGSRVMPQQLDARFGMVYDVFGIRPILAPGEGDGLSSGRPPATTAAADDPAAKAAADAAQKARQQAEAKYLSDVLAREPDWIFVVDRNAAFGPAKAAETMAATPAIANSRAWQQKKVIYLDQDGASWYLMAGSLGLLEANIRQVQAAFDQHPVR